MISKLLKSKNGSFLLLGVIVIPIIIALALTLIGSGMRERNMKISYQSSLDNEAYALAMEFGETYYETSAQNENEMEFCLFKDEDLPKIQERFDVFFQHLDGWNEKWHSEVTIVNNVNHSINANVPESTEFVRIRARIVLPNTNCDSYDKYFNENDASWKKISGNIPNGNFEGSSNNSIKVLFFTSYGSITGLKHVHELTTVIIKEATCSQEQETLTYCTKCGQYFTTSGAIATGPEKGEKNPNVHNFVSYYFVAASCKEQSLALIKCSDCGVSAQTFFEGQVRRNGNNYIELPLYALYSDGIFAGKVFDTNDAKLNYFVSWLTSHSGTPKNPQYTVLNDWIETNKKPDTTTGSVKITSSDIHNMPVSVFSQLLRFYSNTNLSEYNATKNAGYVNVVTQSVNHTFKYESTTLSTCYAEGYDTYRCSLCNAEEQRNFKAKATTGADHKHLIKVNYVAKTCTTNGNKEYYYCSDCGKYFISENEYNLLSPAYQTVSLTKYEVSEQDTIIQKSHNYDYDANTKTGGTVILPTCTTKGFTIVKCKDCSDYYYTNYTNIDYSKPAHNRIIKINGNNVSNEEVENLTKYEAIASTCTTNGNYEYYKCSACEKYYREVNGEFQQINYKDWVLPLDPNNHNYLDYRTANPTCTEQGYTIRKCIASNNRFGCGKETKFDDSGTELYKPVPALGHLSSGYILINAPTCTDTGSEHCVCVRQGCGKEIANSRRELPMLPHTVGDFVTGVAPTCIASGYNIKKCTVCNKNLYEIYGEQYYYSVTYNETSAFKTGQTLLVDESVYQEVNALGHDLVWKKDVAETCEQPAVVNAYCTRSCCVPTQIFATSDNPPEATGHKASGTWVTTLAPTCEEDGTRVQYCSNPWCDKKGEYIVKSEVIEKLGHDFTILVSTTYKTIANDASNGIKVETYKCSRCDKTNDVETTVSHEYVKTIYVQPTCTTDGQSKFTCKNCGYTYIATDLTLLGHEFFNTSVVKPTCTTEGYTNQQCSRCNITRIDPDSYTQALGHDFSGAPVYSAYTSTGLYSCGYLTYTCSRCPQTRRIEANHSFEKYGDSVAPTCTESGYSVYKCSKCSFIKNDAYIPALGHDYSVKVSTLNPTCTEGGNSTYKCSRCSSTTIKDYTNALGHTYNSSQAQYTWSGQDANGATATCVGNNKCSRCSQAPITTTISNITPTKTAPTCVNTGSWNYTANFTQTGFSTQTTKTTISALGHTYNVNNTKHTWSSDLKTCTAENICTRCGVNKIKLTVNTTLTRNKEATCTEQGNYTYSANFNNSNLLNATKSFSPTATGHNFVGTGRYDSNETVHWELKQCTACKIYKEVVESDKSVHNYGSKKIDTKPTCTATGTSHHICSVCGYRENLTESALGHEYQKDNGNIVYTYPAGTISYSGTKTNDTQHILVAVCTRCDIVLNTKWENHNQDYSFKTEECEKVPTITYTCTICSKPVNTIKLNDGNPLPHDWKEIEHINSTCDSDELSKCKCNRCGKEYTFNLGNRKQHVFEVIDTLSNSFNENTCITLLYRCKNCKNPQYDYRNSTHTPVKKDTVAPTCTTAGYDVYKCSKCGYEFHQNFTSELGHNFPSTGKSYAGSDCRYKGYDRFTCTRCNYYKDIANNLPGPHNYNNNWVTTKKPTCENKGTEELKCRLCSTIIPNTARDVAALGHNYITEYGIRTRTVTASPSTSTLSHDSSPYFATISYQNTPNYGWTGYCDRNSGDGKTPYFSSISEYQKGDTTDYTKDDASNPYRNNVDSISSFRHVMTADGHTFQDYWYRKYELGDNLSKWASEFTPSHGTGYYINGYEKVHEWWAWFRDWYDYKWEKAKLTVSYNYYYGVVKWYITSSDSDVTWSNSNAGTVSLNNTFSLDGRTDYNSTQTFTIRYVENTRLYCTRCGNYH